MPHSSSALVIPSVLFLFATLNLVFRFVVPLSDKSRHRYINTIHLAVAVYWLVTDWSPWIMLLVVLLYPDLRKSLTSMTQPRILVGDAVLMYVAGTKMALDSMGLSRLYMRPSVLFGATLLLVASLIGWAILDTKRLKKMDTAKCGLPIAGSRSIGDSSQLT